MKFALRAAGIALLAVVLVACDDEPAERKAFIAFLQTRIIDKPGLHVPHLTGDEAKLMLGRTDRHLLRPRLVGEYAQCREVVLDLLE